MEGIIGPLDAKLDFGEVTLSSSSTQDLPNIIDLGKTCAGGLEVVAQLANDAVGGTNTAISIQGSADNHSFTTIATGETIALSKLKAGQVLRVGVPRDNGYRYLKVTMKNSGSFSDGKIHAWIDNFVGK